MRYESKTLGKGFRTAAAVWIACAAMVSCAIDFGSGPRPDPIAPASDAGTETSVEDAPAPLPLPSDFTDPSRWDFFDLSTVSETDGVGAATLDDQLLYFFPESGTTARIFPFASGVAFGAPASWVTVDLGGSFHASSAAACPDPADQTTVIFFASAEGVRFRSSSNAIGKGFFDATPASSQLDGGTFGWAGAACSGTSVYLAPSSGGATIAHEITAAPNNWNQRGPKGSFRGVAHVAPYELLLVPEASSHIGEMFSSTDDWNAGTVNLSKEDIIAEPTTSTFDGAIYDGHFTYLAPASGQKVARIDATVGTKPYGPWALGPRVSSLGASRGGVFDGRYVYFVPRAGTTIVRYDVSTPFEDSSSYVSFDVTSLPSKPAAFGQLGGAAFDGKYVYFTPTGSPPVIARFRTGSTSMPAAFSGSFY